MRRRRQISRRHLIDLFPLIQDQHPLAVLGHQRQVVANQQHRHPPLFALLYQQFKDLIAQSGIEG